jgi:hypothetical protein
VNVRPLRDRVLVKRVEAQEQRIGGIIIPDTAKEKPQQAKVIAAGKGDEHNGCGQFLDRAHRPDWQLPTKTVWDRNLHDPLV